MFDSVLNTFLSMDNMKTYVIWCATWYHLYNLKNVKNTHGGVLSDCNWTRTQNHFFWPNGWVFVYELSGSRFESSCSHLNFRLRACFEQGVPWHSGNYRVWIHSETRTWHDKNTQSGGVLLLVNLQAKS